MSKPITFPPMEPILTINIGKDYSKEQDQIGCGYCIHEEICPIRDPNVNKAKQGCKDFKHYKK